MATFGNRLKHAFSVFLDRPNADPFGAPVEYGPGAAHRPDRFRSRNTFNERTILASILTRIAIDASAVTIKHVRLDDKKRYLQDMESGLNECLLVKPNLDQNPRHFRQDIYASLFEEGVIAIVPVETDVSLKDGNVVNVRQLRVGKIVQYYPHHVKVNCYNQDTGRREDLVLDKRVVAIVENPLASVINEPNSTLQRLIRKLSLLDQIDEQAGSGKLDLIIQLPYVVKNDTKRQQAEDRRKEIEFQLKDSKYGIAYTDGTEKITQLNRPAENNLWNQITDLTKLLYEQLGITPEVMNGTADEATMLNFNERTVKPLIEAVQEAMISSFLTKTARSQRQWIMYFRDPFNLVPVSTLAEIADKFTRNEILTSNEIRQVVGFAPSTEAKADQLVNSNMPQPEDAGVPAGEEVDEDDGDDALINSAMDDIDATLDQIFADLEVQE